VVLIDDNIAEIDIRNMNGSAREINDFRPSVRE